MSQNIIENKKASCDLTQGPIVKGLVGFAVPLLATSVIQQLYGTVDLLFVGNVLGSNTMAAVGISVLLVTCLIGFFTGLSVGVNVVVARYFGSGAHADVDRAVHTAIALGVAGGLGLSIAGWVLAPLYLEAMATPAELVEDALVYLRVYFLSMLSVVLYNQCAGIFRGVGNSAEPLRAQLVGGLANIALNALFIIVLQLGIAGSALATLASQSIAAAWLLVKLARIESPWALRARKIRFCGDVLRGIVVIGVPTGLQSLVITLSNVFVQYQINLLGVDAIAAFSAYFKVELPIYYAIVALGQAATTFVAQNHAAGLERRARKGTRVCVALGFGVSIALAALLIAVGYWAFWVFSQDAAVIALGREIIGITFPLYWVYVLLEVGAAAMRGRGNSIVPMVVILLNVCVLRTGLLWVSSWSGITLASVALAYPITWASAALCMLACYGVLLHRARVRATRRKAHPPSRGGLMMRPGGSCPSAEFPLPRIGAVLE